MTNAATMSGRLDGEEASPPGEVDQGPLRIAYLVNSYPAPSQSFIRREIAGIEALGLDVTRYTLRRWDGDLVDPDDLAEKEKSQAVLELGAVRLIQAMVAVALSRPVLFAKGLALAIRFGRKAGGSLPTLAKHLIYLAEACILLGWSRRDRIDHVHAHFGTNSTVAAALCHALGGPPFSFTCHGPEEFDKPLVLGLDEKIRRSAFVVAVSNFGRSQLCRWVGYDQWSKIRVVHCGVDPAFLEAKPVPVPSAPRLICVARLAGQKGHLALIDAMARLHAEGISLELLLVGDGPLRGEIEHLIRLHGLEDSVRLLGWRSNAEIRGLIQCSRASVLPSFAEGLPVVIMEALALGRPVISTYVAGIPELVRPGVTGWLVPASSVGPLCQAIREVLDAPVERLETMGREGAANVAECHDARFEAARLVATIRASRSGRGLASMEHDSPRTGGSLRTAPVHS